MKTTEADTIETKFKVGDRIKIIKYGSKHWENKKERKRLAKLGYCPAKPDNIIHEDKNCYYVDDRPYLVGKEGIIAQTKVTQGVARYDIWFLYKKDSMAWFFDDQLKKVKPMKQKITLKSNPKASKETRAKVKRAVKVVFERKKILKEHNIYELLAQHLGLVESSIYFNCWTDNDSNHYVLTKFGFKVIKMGEL